MANTEVGASVEIEYKSVGEMRKAIKDATSEIVIMQQTFGAASQEAINAAKKVADLKDKIEDARETADLFDPGKKFQAFATVGTQIAAGFSAVQGAMALVGSESQDLEKALLKVQGAMALTQGLSELKDFGKSWQQLKIFVANATQGMSTFRKALIATGIGLFVAAIGTLIAYWDDLKDAISGTNDITKAYAESQKEVTKAVQDAKTKFTEVRTSMDLAKQGVISKEQALKTYNEKLGDTFGKATSLTVAENNMAKYTPTYLKAIELRTRAQAFYAKAAEAATKAASGEDIDPSFWQSLGNSLLSGGNNVIFIAEQTKTTANNLADLNDQQKKFTEEADKLISQALIEENKLSQSTTDNIVKNNEKRKEVNNDRINAEKELTKFIQEENQKREEATMLPIQKEVRAINRLYDEKIALAKKYNLDVKQLEALRLQALNDLSNKQVIQEESRLSKQLGDFKAQGPKLGLVQKQLTANEQTEANTRKQIAEDEANNRIQLTQAIGTALGSLSDVVGRETAAGKALAIAQATINTFLGITEVWKSKAVLPEPFNTATKIAATVTTAAGGFAAVRNIAKTKVPGGGGGPTPPPAGNLNAPLSPILSPALTGQALNAEAINNLGNQAVRAYVMNSDIQNNQQRNAYLQRNARIG
jgi:hypothetical protein